MATPDEIEPRFPKSSEASTYTRNAEPCCADRPEREVVMPFCLNDKTICDDGAVLAESGTMRTEPVFRIWPLEVTNFREPRCGIEYATLLFVCPPIDTLASCPT